ncbi:leucine-rich repeat neuronal protein 2-like isoform X2 [Coccinella septempunctata]|uniref:leucine-rich repeat neuronal protein 2-like isoform X2 n=1 Tax=Coccinella septempunctata TaxID=41139 RepID=UPI001D061975|nr:leucine-rich repeat neuronal protein 2-like isoform X2 [Coccinella septempunctata]
MGVRTASLLVYLSCLFLGVRNQPPSSLCSRCNCSNINATFLEVLCLSDIKEIADVIFANGTQGDLLSVSDLTIRYNELNTLADGFATENVVRLDLSFNKISHVKNNVFSRLQKLETLVLSHNNVENLHPNAFQGLYMAGDFYPLRSLRTLMLDHNSIHTLNADLFEHTESVETLSLAYNPLEVIDTHTAIAITNLANLKFLDLSYTQLSALPKYFLHTPKYIEVLNLSGNSFTGVPRELEEAHSLRKFVFNDNAVVELTRQNGFPRIPTLRVLHLCQMSDLVALDAGSLANLTDLQELYVAGNPRLSRIDDATLSTADATGTMDSWPDIKKLYLNDNQISYINKSLLAHWSTLAELDLSNNPWTCECENQWMVETLMPVYLKIDEDKAKAMKCAAPVEMTSYTFEELHKRNYNMRCLDLYGAQPERDAAMLVGTLAGLLLGIPLVLFCIYSYRRHWFGYFDDSAASFSRQFYRRTNDVYEY